MGRCEESIAETTKALELDPLSLIIPASCAGAFWLAGQPDRAIETCYNGLELDAGFAPLHWLLAHVFQAKAMLEEAVRERQKSLDLSPDSPVFIGELGSTYAAAGARVKALEILEQLREISKQRYVMAYWVALIHTGQKERDEAFRWLEKAHEERSAHLAIAKVDPRLEYLRSDPRFDVLLRKLDLDGPRERT
jgi:serine/threonine-protein kinase